MVKLSNGESVNMENVMVVREFKGGGINLVSPTGMNVKLNKCTEADHAALVGWSRECCKEPCPAPAQAKSQAKARAR